MGDFYKNWPFITGFVLLFFGFIISLSSGNSVVVLSLIMIVFGAGFGRVWYAHRNNHRLGYFIVISGFLIGIIIGFLVISLFLVSEGNSLITLIVLTILYISSLKITYYLHEKGYIHATDY